MTWRLPSLLCEACGKRKGKACVHRVELIDDCLVCLCCAGCAAKARIGSYWATQNIFFLAKLW